MHIPLVLPRDAVKGSAAFFTTTDPACSIP